MTTPGDNRLAILGCGAVAESAHLPALARMQNVRAALLVDTNAERRQRLAAKFNVEQTAAEVDGHYDLFDAAIVALPHALHAPVSVKLLAQGKSVLVEKPMAITVADCDAMIGAADRTGAILGVGLFRRFIWSLQFARSLVQEGVLGQLESFDFREGNIYNWPVASDFFFRKEAAGGGVLIDTGAHTLDSLLHLLGDFSDVEYFDDAEGGVEANCLIKLRLQNGAPGTVELSRTRKLRNTGIVRGTRGVLEITLGWDQLLGWSHLNHLKLTMPGQPYVLDGPVGDPNEVNKTQDFLPLIIAQLEDFLDAIREGRRPVADGQSARSSIHLIETSYSNRKPLTLPWVGHNPGIIV
jgi:predicted dehydrogenase